MQSLKMNTKFGRFLIPGVALFASYALNVSAAIPAVEKILPDDTLVVLTTPDYTKLREIYRTSPQTQFWNDPAMKPFKDKFLSKFSEDLLQPLERDLGIHFTDY